MEISGCWKGRMAVAAVLLALAAGAGERVEGQAGTAPQAGTAAQGTQRPTSAPYAGDLGIFEYPDRDRKLQIGRVMDLLGIQPGRSVADLGAGSGWFTVRAAQRVGPAGTVFAEDINPKAVEAIEERVRRERLGNVRTVLGTPDHPRLPVRSVDAVLMLKVYHEIAHPVPLMKEVREALKPGAKVGIIDRNGNGSDHGLDRAVVEQEMAEAGFRVEGRYDFTKADGQDYFLVFMSR
ncbi:MAG: class I SAM-dependent methyltransferase [Acidobacteriaceae bacterium]